MGRPGERWSRRQLRRPGRRPRPKGLPRLPFQSRRPTGPARGPRQPWRSPGQRWWAQGTRRGGPRARGAGAHGRSHLGSALKLHDTHWKRMRRRPRTRTSSGRAMGRSCSTARSGMQGSRRQRALCSRCCQSSSSVLYDRMHRSLSTPSACTRASQARRGNGAVTVPHSETKDTKATVMLVEERQAKTARPTVTILA